MSSFVDKEFGIPYFRTVWAGIASIGWYVVAVIISLWYIFPYMKKKYINWKLRKNEQEYAAKYYENPDLLQERLTGLEASRQKMQQEYYQKSVLMRQECAKQKGKTKEVSRLILDNNFLGHKLGSKNNDFLPFEEKKHKSVKKEYNPLMGDGSRGYRPPKRNCCSKSCSN